MGRVIILAVPLKVVKVVQLCPLCSLLTQHDILNCVNPSWNNILLVRLLANLDLVTFRLATLPPYSLLVSKEVSQDIVNVSLLEGQMFLIVVSRFWEIFNLLGAGFDVAVILC